MTRRKLRNEDRPWSKTDLIDLKDGVASGVSIAELADFLLRRESEVAEKIGELGLIQPPSVTNMELEVR